MTEDEFIKTLQTGFPSHIGDDCAVLPLNHEQDYVISKDVLVEDVHFRLKNQSMLSLAHKAVHVNLSDIAAMGAEAKYIMLGLSVPPNFVVSLKEFSQKFLQVCKQQNIILIGGDTTKSLDKLMISITVIGLSQNQFRKHRHTSKEGDKILVVGELGNAHLGFLLSEYDLLQESRFLNNFFYPQALLKEGAWLAKKKSVTAMMDLSDGLFLDLKKLLFQKKIGAHILLDHLKVPKDFADTCHKLKLDPYEIMVTGGEDYSLLFTVCSSKAEELIIQFQSKFKTRIHDIGYVTNTQKIEYFQKGKKVDMNLEPFFHF